MSAQTTEKDRAWLLPPDTCGKMPPGLYLIATPAGNLGDFTVRALDVLAACDLVLCEDTRVSGKLLQHFGLKKSLQVYNDHSDERRRADIIKALKEGRTLALISDAGTPLVSDPGYKLVRACLAEDIYVTSLPGANAVLPALQLSGLPTDRFCFLGFLPPKSEACRRALAAWNDVPACLVVYETAPRLLKTLTHIQAVLGEREVAVARELTKLYEEVRRGPVGELIDHYQSEGLPKGEIVLVIASLPEQQASLEEVQEELRTALRDMNTKDAAAFVAKKTGRPRRELYDMALELKR